MICGSIAEFPVWYIIQNLTDVDIMHTPSPVVVALSSDVPTPHADGFTFARINSCGVHPGCALLMYDQNKLTYDDLIRGELPRHGPAYKSHQENNSFT